MITQFTTMERVAFQRVIYARIRAPFCDGPYSKLAAYCFLVLIRKRS